MLQIIAIILLSLTALILLIVNGGYLMQIWSDC